VLPAFHYRNDLGIELLRATMNLPLLQCDDVPVIRHAGPGRYSILNPVSKPVSSSLRALV
jgi:hypothetical protein